MILLSILAAYILIGLIVTCLVAGYCIVADDHLQDDELRQAGYIWPVTVIIFIVAGYRWAATKADDWFMRSLAKAF